MSDRKPGRVIYEFAPVPVNGAVRVSAMDESTLVEVATYVPSTYPEETARRMAHAKLTRALERREREADPPPDPGDGGIVV